MDHLPKVAGANKKDGLLEVPYLLTSDQTYTPRGVLSFCIMQQESLKNFPAEEPSSAAPTSFFQSFLAKPYTQKVSQVHRELLAATQLFLYFGLLVEAFAVGGVYIDPKKFVTQSSRGSPIVTTSALTEYICYWHLNVDCLSSAVKNRHLDQLLTLFGIAAAWLTAWGSRLRFVDPPPSRQTGYSIRFFKDCHHPSYPRAQAVLLSIRILCETLHTACKVAYSSASIPIEMPKHRIIRSTFMQGSSEFVDQLMLDAGRHLYFCAELKAFVLTLADKGGVQMKLRTVDRNRLGRDHSRCTRQRCYRLVEYPYFPGHLRTGCECQNVSTCSKEGTGDGIVSIIRQGSIPLIRIRPHAPDNELLELSSYDPKGSPSSRPAYVAISHVWSDGMGNRAGNYLPACQIRELQYSVNFAHNNRQGMDEAAFNAMEDVYFWIDTLCIPRHHQKEKKRAIQSMADIYRNSALVLVIDKGIQRSDLATSLEDRLMIVAESNWGRRLWTLQESRLAPKLCFNFADGVYSVESREQFIISINENFWSALTGRLELTSVVAEIQSGANSTTAKELLLALACRYEEASTLYQSFGNPDPELEEHPAAQRFFRRIGEFWLAESVLNHSWFKVAGFLASEDSSLSQSRRLLDLCENLKLRRTTEPADEAVTIAALLNADLKKVLNTNGKDRMSVVLRSLETVPAALIFFQGKRYEEDGLRWIPKSILLQNGRLGDIWCYLNSEILGQAGRPQREGLLVKFPGLRLLHPPESDSPERCYLVHGSAKYVLALTEGNKLQPARTDWSQYADRELAVILTTSLDDATLPAWEGILVSRRKEDGGVYYARFEHILYVHRAEDDMKHQFISVMIDWPGQTGRENYTPIQVLPSDQAWCVG
ncbi:MAG: hypothetical protein M1839_002824 [Geoglossum umbratile]|nr:MAG: hypothetical protein M1839_002824 [Geoglossum umbratile]